MDTRILVATDGTPASNGALRLSLRLAQASGAGVDVLLVAETAVERDTAIEVDTAGQDLFDSWSEPIRARLEGQLAALGVETAAWVKLIGFGSPGTIIPRVAAERGAALILLGMRRGAQPDSGVRGETVMRVIHSSPVPVLAVPPEAVDLPSRVLVAVDFDFGSLSATRALLPLLPGHASLHLAHVALPVSTAPAMLQEWENTYLTGAATRLEELARELEEPGRISVSTHVAAGDPEEKLLELAGQLRPDLLAVGSPNDLGRGADSRSVALALIRRAACPVLVAPADVRSRDARPEPVGFAGAGTRQV